MSLTVSRNNIRDLRPKGRTNSNPLSSCANSQTTGGGLEIEDDLYYLQGAKKRYFYT